MNAKVADERPEWTPKLRGPGRAAGWRSQRLVLVGARFKLDWLEQASIAISEVHLEGDLGQAVTDLLAAARDTSATPGMALPVTRLRASILARVPSIIGLDRDLGTVRKDQPRRAALTINRWATMAESSVAETVVSCLRRWYYDALSGWAERYANSAIAERVEKASTASNVRIVNSQRRLLLGAGAKSRPDYVLIGRQVAESLIGEELFEGLGPCELVTDALYRDPGRGNAIELMTAPMTLNGRAGSFSMVAHLAVVSIPYSNEIFLRVSASKRTWASKMPGPKRNAPFAVRGYVMGPERPFFTVSLARTQQDGWMFGDDYAEWQQLSDGALPASLADAVARQVPGEDGWWAGLPLLTTLFDSVPQRTVFEGDELDLREEVVNKLPEVFEPEIPFRTLQLPRRRSTGGVAMLKLSDLGLSGLGVAGQVLDESEVENGEEADDDASEATGDIKRRASLERHREQNIRALNEIHAGKRPVLWSFCSSEQERTVIARTVEQLFGDAVQLYAELLPQNTHGLLESLPGSRLAQRERFDLRVQAWKAAAETVRAGSGPRHALICASDRDHGRAEDPVNYYAGLHAMCDLADANVHHVLPIGSGNAAKAMQHFVHRLQSALLDVFFAHSGKVFGTREFMTSLFGERTPAYVYGLQAARSQARAFSGEAGVCFLLFTRLEVEKGTTEVRLVYRTKRNTERTKWMPLNEGVRWLGSQRSLETDERWLRDVSAREIRDFLGALNAEDPRAFVLVDWSTMGSLWKGLSDEDLTRDGIARINDKNIAAACPQITLVRLRKGEHTIALRARNTALFQRSGHHQALANLEVTGELYTEIYATTTKAIVALEAGPTATAASVRAPRHYIQSMGYRNTVQIVRGQSCFRPKPRMRRSNVSKHAFQLQLLEPSQDDAALPAPLEVTVMACPTDINPDQIAVAVLGLRLGYVHYNDWTALPAPLFFKRKVDDHIVRYRSPSNAASGEDSPDEIDPSALALSSIAESIEPSETGGGGADAEAPRSEYLLQATQEVAPAATDEPAAAPPASAEVTTEPVADVACQRSSTLVSDEELRHISEAPAVSDEQLIEIVKRLGGENFALFGDGALGRRPLYDMMMRGQIRVQVPTPSFVTPEGIFKRPPTDKEAMRRFWRDRIEIGWVRHGESMPPLAKLSHWIWRRLQTPQAGYAVWSSRLFPRRPLFLIIHERWEQYVAERTASAAPDDSETRMLANASVRFELLTQWAVDRADDELLGWLLVGSAQFPSREVLQEVLPYLKEPIGEATRAALYYFIDSACASRAVINGTARQKNGGLVFPLRGPLKRTIEVMPPVASSMVSQGLSGKDKGVGAVTASRDSATVANVSTLSTTALWPHSLSDSPAPLTPNTLLVSVEQLIPGRPEFDTALEQVRQELSALEAVHRDILRAKEEARAKAEAEAVSARARAAHLVRWAGLRSQATQLLEAMRTEVPDLQSLRVTPVEDAPESMDEAARMVREMGEYIEAAKQAQEEHRRVDVLATPPANLTSREATRHRVQWQDAVRSALEVFDAALASLSAYVRASPLFAVGESVEPIAVEPVAVGPDETEGMHRETADAEAPRNYTEPVNDVAVTNLADPNRTVDKPQSVIFGEEGIAVELPGSDDKVEASSDGPVEELEPESTLEPMAHRARAQVVLELVRRRAYAAAATYLQAIQLDTSAGRIGDHALVAAAAIEAVHRLRSNSDAERPESAALRARVQELDNIQLPGCDPLAAGLGILSAGICEMLFPSTGAAARWTYLDQLQHRFSEQPPLHAFIERIKNLDGIYLAHGMLTEASIGVRHATLNQVARMRERAKNWHSDEILFRNWTATDYRQLHEALFRNEELPVARCLGLISRGEDGKLADAYREARKVMSKPVPMIDGLAKRIGRRRSFDGVARGHITGNIQRTQQFIEEYLEAVRRASGLQAPVGANARGALQGLYQDLTAAAHAVEALNFEDYLAAMYRELALTVLLEVKRMFDCGEPTKGIADADQMLLLRLPLGVNGKPSLASQQNGSGTILPPVVEPLTAIEEVESLDRRLQDSGELHADPKWIEQQLARACDDHLTHHRLLAARLIDQRLGRSPARNGEQVRALGFLRGSLHQERQRVTHAMALGALSQPEATPMLRLIEEVLQTDTALGDPLTAPVGMPDFPHAFDALRRLVIQPLDAKLTKSKIAFLRDLDAYLEQHPSAPELASQIDRIRGLTNDSASSMRAARDMFSLLKEGSLPPKVNASTTTLAEDYQVFVRTLRESLRGHRPLVEALVNKLREARREDEHDWLAMLDASARAEAATFLENWEKVCGAKSPQECEQPLIAFFRGLRPLEPSVSMTTDSHNPHRTEFFLNNSPLGGLDRTTSALFVPPMLGSERQYILGIVMRQASPEAAVTQALDERGQGAPTFLLSRANWTLEHRAALSRHHSVLLVDDNLVAYAAIHPAERLQRLLQVALLTFNGNPYDDYGGRPVPPEMFFGRQPELRRLRQVKMAAVLYGGRRLGKSSLLDQLQRDTQGRAQEAVLLLAPDRADRGLSDDHMLLVWSAVYRRLLHMQVLEKPKSEPTSAKSIQRWIEGEILSGNCKARGIYLLIDEADEVMGRDLHEGGPLIQSLLQLCDSVRGKCAMRFVIAGLHNLTRMANHENSPLGKFDTIALRPFWSAEDIQRGIELIKTPLEALGFHFGPGREDIPLRIMAVCNFYPAFIQLYCKRLVEHLYERRDKNQPPTYITEKDLDSVEHNREFLGEIRSKFKLNLDLDKRYAAIALILADQYYSDGARALTPTEIRNLCDLLASRHFETTGQGALESLLDEMETLTILERVGARYALRTPNIAMLLGDRDSIGQQLEALSAEIPVRSRSRGEYRATMVPLDGKARDRPTFPMPGAWVRHALGGSLAESNAGGSQVDRQLLIFVGNELSGLPQIAQLRGEWQLGDAAVCQFGVFQSPNAARQTLLRSARSPSSRNAPTHRLHCIGGAWTANDIAEYARLAATIGTTGGVGGADPRSSAVTRLALIAHPARAYEVAKLARSSGSNVANWRVVPVPFWTDDALYFHLERLEKPDIANNEAARKALLAASCGFGEVIERLCTGRLRLDEALRAVATAEKTLAPDLATFYGKIGLPPAIGQQERKNAEELLRVLDGEVRDPERTEEFRVESGVTAELFDLIQWMGLLQDAPGGIWHVPGLLRSLLS